MNKNTIILTVVSVVAIFGFLMAVYAFTNNTDTKVYAEVNKVLPTDHVKWSPAKKHLLVEYSDLQCPACKNFHSYIQDVIEKDSSITNNITFIYRHFPLDQHIHSHEAAYAAEAAGKQGKFFEFTDTLFNTQTVWESSSDVKAYFYKVATDLHLDLDKFKADMDSKEAKNVVDANVQQGGAADVSATPTFYLDGKKIDVASLEEFKSILKNAK